MATIARLTRPTSMKLTPPLIALTIALMTATSAVHAEKYCKSVDQSGNASYTLAPETGCNKKKYKTVAINHHIAKQTPVTTTPEKSAVVTTIQTPTVSAAPAAIANVSDDTDKPRTTIRKPQE